MTEDMLREREAAMAALSQVRLRLCHADGCTQPGTVTFVSRRGCTQPAPRGCIYVTAVLIEVLERRMLPLAVRSPRVLKELLAMRLHFYHAARWFPERSRACCRRTVPFS
eukprot:183832-Prorocentrum_minimum.AAC.1